MQTSHPQKKNPRFRGGSKLAFMTWGDHRPVLTLIILPSSRAACDLDYGKQTRPARKPGRRPPGQRSSAPVVCRFGKVNDILRRCSDLARIKRPIEKSERQPAVHRWPGLVSVCWPNNNRQTETAPAWARAVPILLNLTIRVRWTRQSYCLLPKSHKPFSRPCDGPAGRESVWLCLW